MKGKFFVAKSDKLAIRWQEPHTMLPNGQHCLTCGKVQCRQCGWLESPDMLVDGKCQPCHPCVEESRAQ